jgi:hypothetical protein
MKIYTRRPIKPKMQIKKIKVYIRLAGHVCVCSALWFDREIELQTQNQGGKIIQREVVTEEKSKY